jgi:hypothetical protein
MTAKSHRRPRGARGFVRAVAVPFLLGFAASTLAWATFSSRCCEGFLCGMQEMGYSVMVVAVAMPVAGFVTSVVSGTGHRILGFVSAAAGVAIPILWAVMIECPRDTGNPIGQIFIALSLFGGFAWFGLAIGYFAHWVVRTQWKPDER